ITSGPLGGALLMPVTLGSAAHIRVDYLGRVEMNGQSATFEWPTQIAELNGTGSIAPATLQVYRGTFSGTLSGSPTLGSLPNANIAGVTHLSCFLFDAEVANVIIEANGSIDPGPLEGHVYGSTGIGTITATSLSLAGAYNCDFDANTADQIIVKGPIS